uniref:ATP synthase F0 subunit 8 n=1 Tax=Potamyia horvati TaxID=1875909 RepID=UPI0022384407|nr:ATP synthase F0 subunit 8 [Potamyia horvati]UYO79429.1 ATP synthase F0 subunit 8 [Potamyia horvati]
MPQMMPINWLLLMYFFILIFIFYNSFFYFSKITFNKALSNSNKNFFFINKISWKW